MTSYPSLHNGHIHVHHIMITQPSALLAQYTVCANAGRHSDTLKRVKIAQPLPNRKTASTPLTLPPASRAGPHL